MASPIAKHAIIIGAGIAGLTAAKALSAHFESVTILDRDALPERPVPRRGTPQARHVHALLAGGQKALAELFPGFEQAIECAGAVRARAGLDVMVERPGYDPFPQRDLGFDSFCLSRPLLEFMVKRAIERQARISVRSHTRVVELLASPDGISVIGVLCETAQRQIETIEADLVVDASGRGGLTLALLEAIGHPKPDETLIGIDQGYSTAIFEIPDDAPTTWKGVLHMATPPDSSRGALILPMERGRWIVGLGGNHGDAPPGDVDGYMAFVKTLRTRTVFNAIRNAKRISDIARFKLPASVWRHFERLERFPNGLLVIGDSLCRFNPVFGQGMSVAAQQACLLSRLIGSRTGLSDPLVGLAPAFFAETQGLLEAPWATAVSDFVFPETRGDRPADFDTRLQYGRALIRLAAHDASVHKILAEVNSLLRPQRALRDPQLASRITEIMQILP